jgi:hypothetical protein
VQTPSFGLQTETQSHKYLASPQKHRRHSKGSAWRNCRAVDDHVVIGHNARRVLAGQSALVQLNFDAWVYIGQPVARRFEFAAADIFCSVKNLPLQIGEIDTVEIDSPSFPTPAAARYSAAGEPKPPAPMHKTRAALSRFCPSQSLQA